MSNYQFVNIRFNLNKEDEKELFNKLNPSNRAGNVKQILKKYFVLEDGDFLKKLEIKSLIKELMDKEIHPKEEKKIIHNVSTGGIKIIVGGKETTL